MVQQGLVAYGCGPGDIFVQKSPAPTILTLGEAVRETFQTDNEIQILGTRHSEKLYKPLSRAEMVKAEDRIGPPTEGPCTEVRSTNAQYRSWS
jgi:FlaA1/EpsC-like NDP-sugar epimerase